MAGMKQDEAWHVTEGGNRRLVICGSPFRGGKAEKVAKHFCEHYAEVGEQADLILLAQSPVAGCRGCNACANKVELPQTPYWCVISDTMVQLQQKLCTCDQLTVVAPLYFSGAPSQLKAFYDRLQPFFWSRPYCQQKRPFDLVCLGEGGDPYGCAALVSESRSSLAIAGFAIRYLHDLVGCVAEDGTFDSRLWQGAEVDDALAWHGEM